ncbi:MAG: sulfatase-like hydrolase/transferase [Myxococcota bacterium]|nr:sulfatase-like hydrolase/transferase [Myxococcota bacterium]
MGPPSKNLKNIIVLLTDQQRDAGPYESTGMGAFRRDELHGFNALCARGTRFTQHRINASACAPSRASMLTGYSPWVHGVTQTDGFAKRYDDPAQIWLPPNKVPTLGHRFQAAGWQSVYIGKWHLSHADIEAIHGGTSVEVHQCYVDAQPLSPYGFEGWIGPEPHGADIKNAGVNRDDGYVSQAEDFLRRRAASDDARPFLMVVSLVNPHDIVFWPAWSMWKRSLLDLEGIGDIGAASSEASMLVDEPEALKSYRDAYFAAYGPRGIVEWIYTRAPETYRRFYASLMRRADRQIAQVLAALAETGLEDSTHVVCTSDHGELLGSHGGLHQKWYNAFEETLRVPMVIAEAEAPSNRRGVVSERLSSHEDLVPTLLSLAEIDDSLDENARAGFERVPKLPGRDLRFGDVQNGTYYITQDDILAGQTPEAAVGRRFKWLGAMWKMRYPDLGVARNSLEAWTGTIAKHDPTGSLWKVIRYFDPAVRDVQPDDEWLLFNLSKDPTEEHNLAGNADSQTVLSCLKGLLEADRR